MAAAPPDAITVGQAKETLEVAFRISQLLDTGLDRESLSLLIGLCENGVNPEALAVVVRELRREAAALREAQLRAHGAAH